VRQAIYRARQFFDAALARVNADDLEEADKWLSPPAQKLFRQMSAGDQRHSLAVMRALKQGGQTHPALLAAALLHDVGKSQARLTLVHRTLIVLLGRFWPAALDWLAREPADGWRQPFVTHRRHAELGAHRADQAGCAAMTVTLIRRHQELVALEPRDEIERLLVQLQQADKTH